MPSQSLPGRERVARRVVGVGAVGVGVRQCRHALRADQIELQSHEALMRRRRRQRAMLDLRAMNESESESELRDTRTERSRAISLTSSRRRMHLRSAAMNTDASRAPADRR